MWSVSNWFEESQTEAIESPCIGVCTLDDQQVCVGCQRTADEIAQWATFSDAQRTAIMQRVEWDQSGATDE